MNVIGLTGGIATGKSTVARMLRERHGVPVIDLDVVAREIVAPGQPALQAIAEAFGPSVLQGDGSLDRRALRHLISEDEDARRTLEEITHPAIRLAAAERLAGLAASGATAAVVEAALLVETGSYQVYPVLIVVSCHPGVQLQRLVARDDMTPDQARLLINTQLPMADKEAVATYVIRNEGSIEALEERVDEVWAEIAAGEAGTG